MTEAWFKVLEKSELDKIDFSSKEYTFDFQDLGEKKVTIFKGSLLSVLIDDVYLVLGIEGVNESSREGRLAMIDTQESLWLGFKID